MAEDKKASKAEEKSAKKAAKKADGADKASAKKKKSKKNPFKSIASFFKSVKSEGKKVTWAKPKEVLKNSIVVLIVCVIAGIGIFAVDTILSQGMKGIKKLADNQTSVSDTADTSTTGDVTEGLEADDTTAAQE